MNEAAQRQQKIYHLHPFVLWLHIFYLVLMLVSTLYIGYEWLVRGVSSDMMKTFLGIAGMAIMLWKIVIVQKTRIEVSHEGMTFYSLGFCMYTPWSSIVTAQELRHPTCAFSLSPNPVFVLKAPAIRHVALHEGKHRGIAVIEKDWGVCFADPSSYVWYFPVPNSLIRTQEWGTGVFGHYLRHYLPHRRWWTSDPYP